MKIKRFIGLLAAVGVMTSAASGWAALVFNSATNYVGSYYGTTNEFGDQIRLIDGIERIVTQFKFEYWLNHAATGTEKAQFKIYDNSGTGESPNAVLYDSGSFTIKSGYNTVTLDNLGLLVPDSFTWSVQFTGTYSGEQFGLLLIDQPALGTSYSDFWEKVGSNWGTKTIPGVNGNFSAQVTAIVPEPTTIQLSLLAGLVAGASMLRRKFSSK